MSAITNIAYVSDTPSPIIDELMKAVGAYRTHYSEYVDSVENLTELMQEMRNFKPAELDEDIADNLTVLDKFIHSKLQHEPKALQRQVSDSFQYILSLLDSTVNSDMLRNQIQELIIDFILSLTRLEEDNTKLSKELENVKNSNFGVMQGVSSFQQYTYTGNSKVLLIKEHSPTRYLTSFLIAFARYMTDLKTVKTKLIIVDRDSDTVAFRYGDIIRADSTNLKQATASLTLSSVVYTTTPINSIMDVLMSSIGIELFIVLDRTYKKTDVITGRNITTANAVSSRRLMRSLGLQANETILNDLGEQSQLGLISMIDSYPKDAESRIDIQQRAYETNMKNLSTFVGIQI